jgi:hypothetical protein
VSTSLKAIKAVATTSGVIAICMVCAVYVCTIAMDTTKASFWQHLKVMKDKGGENKYKKNKKNKGAKKNDKKYKEVDKPIYIP